MTERACAHDGESFECDGCSSHGVVMVTSWRPRRPVAPWLEGQTAAGRTVYILGDPYCDNRAEVWIDHERAYDLCLSLIHI